MSGFEIVRMCACKIPVIVFTSCVLSIFNPSKHVDICRLHLLSLLCYDTSHPSCSNLWKFGEGTQRIQYPLYFTNEHYTVVYKYFSKDKVKKRFHCVHYRTCCGVRIKIRKTKKKVTE
eukprot:UN11383